MTFDAPKNANYAAQIVKVPVTVDLNGLDNLVGVPILGHQSLTQRDGVAVGDLKVAFTAETQLSEAFTSQNNLYRDSELNADKTEAGYLEKNRRIRAIKLRGHRSDALLMPLESLAFTGIDPATLREGDTFDTVNGHEICRKYELPIKGNPNSPANKLEKAFKRVTTKQFPEHISTDNYWRNKHLLADTREAIVTQKLHGTSIRVGRVPCLREKGRVEKFLNRWFPTADHVYDAVFGSRKVIKDVNNPRQAHYYATDIWTEYGRKIADLIPDGYIVYGELIGWTPDGGPIQKGYTYDQPKGSAELYVYRVATINAQGTLADLSWDGVKEFCTARGLKWAPELSRVPGVHPHPAGNSLDVEAMVNLYMDKRYAEMQTHGPIFVESPVPLSDKKTVDEGICIRQDGVVPTILKAKAPAFLLHETKLLDAEEIDLESAA
jgi:hypothetical protein